METLAEWSDRVTHGLSHRRIATELGVTNTALSRWIRTGQFPAVDVVRFARHYGADVIEALAVAGYITEEEFRPIAVRLDVREVPTVVMTEELHRRALEKDIASRLRAGQPVGTPTSAPQ